MRGLTKKPITIMKILSPSALLALAAASQAQKLEWSVLPPLPDPHGFAAPVAGVARGALLVGGGANFPDKMPWEGGTKIWYDRVWVLDAPDGAWKEAGRLPRPLGYGVSVSVAEGVFCAGGADSQSHRAETFLLDLKEGKLDVRPLRDLPVACANMCGAVLGRTVFVAGGQAAPDSTSAFRCFWSFDLDHPDKGWAELDPWPGAGRILAVAAAADGSFFLCGGCSLAPDANGKATRTYLTDAYRFTPGKGWAQIPDLPRAAVAAPSPAPVIKGRTILVLGGDDGTKANFEPKTLHPGFPRGIMAYDTKTRQWGAAGEVPAPRATVPVVEWHGKFVIPNGEVRPGVRSPEVHVLAVKDEGTGDK